MRTYLFEGERGEHGDREDPVRMIYREGEANAGTHGETDDVTWGQVEGFLSNR